MYNREIFRKFIMPIPVNSIVFTFHLPRNNEKQEDQRRENNLIGTANAIILKTKVHMGKDSEAYIPVGAFDKGAYIKDKNADSKIDAEEVSDYLNSKDIADGKDGKIYSDTVNDDYLDLFGFQACTTKDLELLAMQEKTYQSLKKVNSVCSAPSFVAKKLLEELVFPKVEQKEIEFIMTNAKLKKYVKEVMYQENPKETIYILEKYGYSEKDLNS